MGRNQLCFICNAFLFFIDDCMKTSYVSTTYNAIPLKNVKKVLKRFLSLNFTRKFLPPHGPPSLVVIKGLKHLAMRDDLDYDAVLFYFIVFHQKKIFVYNNREKKYPIFGDTSLTNFCSQENAPQIFQGKLQLFDWIFLMKQSTR